MANIKNEHLFLTVKPRDFVLIVDPEIAKVLTCIRCSIDPDVPALFQALNVDTGEINCIHSEEVNGIVSSRKSS